MTLDRRHPGEDPELHVSQSLRRDLAALFEPDIDVPAEVDEAILAQARQRMAALRRRRMVYRLVRTGVAAGAAVAAVLLIARPLGDLDRPGMPAESERQKMSVPLRTAESATEPHDIDGSGRVDILDAFAMARRLDAGEPGEPAWDFNGDGAVDERDIDAVAMAAVALRGGV